MRRAFVIPIALVIGIAAAVAASAGTLVASDDFLGGKFAVGATGGIVKPNGQIGNEPRWVGAGKASGLDLRYGWNGTAHADYFLTRHLAVGPWYGQSDLRMKPEKFYLSSGPQTFYMLVRGQTSMYGLNVTAYLPSERSWAPYLFVGVANYTRKLNVSQSLRDIGPGPAIAEVNDTRVGYDAGLGFEQPLTRSVGLNAELRQFYSGSLKKDVGWLGGTLAVDDWQFWSVNVGLTWHASSRSASH